MSLKTPPNNNDHYFESYGFDEKKFDQLLNGQQAQNMLYLAARLCPCRARSTGAPSASCKRCQGLGYTYKVPQVLEYAETFYYGSQTRPPKLLYQHSKDFDLVDVRDNSNTVYHDTRLEQGILKFGSTHPATGQAFTVRYSAPLCMRGLVTSVRDTRPIRQDLGFIQQGGFNLTFPYKLALPGLPEIVNPAFYCSEPDRFVLLDSRILRQDILYKGETDLLLYGFIFEVLECYSIESDGREVCYQLGYDYKLEQSRVVWLNDKLADGRPYAVRYVAAPEYYIHSEQPQVRHQGHKNLPRRVGVKLWSTHPRFESVGRSLP